MKIKKINSYISKKFLTNFLQVCFGFSLLIFFINFLDALDKIRETGAPAYIAGAMALMQIPDFLNDIITSVILISSIITFFLLSSRSEITIMRSAGLSIWQISLPLASTAFFIGIFWIIIFGPISVQMIKKFNSLESRYVNNEMREVVAPRNGIWIKQVNVEAPEETIIIQAKKAYQKTSELGQVTFWFFDEENKFYKKINAKEMKMINDFWLLKDITINESDKINKQLDSLSIPTNLDNKFVMQQIVNNFQNVKLFTIFELPNLIKELSDSGFNPTKFKIYLHSLISKPLLFIAMSLIACYFGLNHVRNKNNITMIFLGIVIGLLLYIISSIAMALGSSGIISIFSSTWIITLICIAIGVLLIYQKEHS